MTSNGLEIAIVGAGGIGSNLVSILVPAIHRGDLVEGIGTIRVRIFDSDVVSEGNMAHQRFSREDVGRPKVWCLGDSLSEFESHLVSIHPVDRDVREADDLERADLVVVGVDSPSARMIVHSTEVPWLDLRCAGDNYIALDSRMDQSKVNEMTNEDQEAGSCQMQGALESGNIQFGHIAAAAHGAQWVIQTLRALSGSDSALPPNPKASSITFGTLERIETQ